MLNNSINQEQLANDFSVEDIVCQFSEITESDLKLRALFALSLFAYNNLENQSILKDTKQISYNLFRTFIDSPNLKFSAMACFQVCYFLVHYNRFLINFISRLSF